MERRQIMAGNRDFPFGWRDFAGQKFRNNTPIFLRSGSDPDKATLWKG